MNASNSLPALVALLHEDHPDAPAQLTREERADAARVARRLGLSEASPDRIEEDLRRIVPNEDRAFFAGALALHGRTRCTATSLRAGHAASRVCVQNSSKKA